MLDFRNAQKGVTMPLEDVVPDCDAMRLITIAKGIQISSHLHQQQPLLLQHKQLHLPQPLPQRLPQHLPLRQPLHLLPHLLLLLLLLLRLHLRQHLRLLQAAEVHCTVSVEEIIGLDRLLVPRVSAYLAILGIPNASQLAKLEFYLGTSWILPQKLWYNVHRTNPSIILI